MKKRLAQRLTYANVVSSICLFLLLGGGAAVAANQLAKNSVGANQLKKNAVTSSKIKNGAVTGAKIKASTLGTVPNATNAVNATNATNSAALGGQTPDSFQQRIRWALVDEGKILQQSGGITVLHDPFGCKTGCDFLDFGSSQAGKGIVATSSLEGNSASTVNAGVCDTGTLDCFSGTPAEVNTTSHVIVRTQPVGSGSYADGAYYIAVIG